jgi:ribose transport system substrate-binding protein
MGVDLLIISPKESVPLTKPVAEAMAAKIPVIVLDRRLMGEEFSCFIGGDNKKIGAAAGQWIRKALSKDGQLPKGKIVELKGLMTSTPAQDRHSGFVEGAGLLQDDHELEIIFEADMKWLEQEARKEMESALAVHSDIDLVYAHNDPAAHGAWLAAKQAGREESILFVGIDALPHEGVRYVREGILDATFAYPTGGAKAIEVALEILAGKPVPKEIVLGTRLFTKANVEQGGEEIR